MNTLVEDLTTAQRRWWVFLVLGVLMIVLGIIAISMPVVITLGGVLYFGILLLIDGAWQVVSAFTTRHGGLFFHLLLGFLDAIVGILLLSHPEVGALAITALLAVLFLVGGLLRAALAAGLHYPGWGWSVVSGLIGAVLGIYILVNWQEMGPVLIGLLIGIDLLFRGWAWLFSSFALRGLPAGAEDKPTA